MSEAFLVRRGGLADAFAVIAVSYPAGSTCTCTCGTRVLRAKDTSGSYPFMIPYAGTWTVKATNGTNTASQAVSITRRYQAQSVQLLYELHIVGNGTSGVAWTTNGSSIKVLSPENGAYRLELAYSSGAGRVDFFASTPAIDFTKYSTLYMKAHSSATSQYQGALISGARYSRSNAVPIEVNEGSGVNGLDFTKAIDVSYISGNQYIGMYVSMWSGAASNIFSIDYLYLR